MCTLCNKGGLVSIYHITILLLGIFNVKYLWECTNSELKIGDKVCNFLKLYLKLFLNGFVNVNVRRGVIYLFHRWSQNACIIIELLEWRDGHFWHEQCTVPYQEIQCKLQEL